MLYKSSKIAIFLIILISSPSYGVLTWTGSAEDLDTVNDSVTGTVSDGVNTTGYTLTLTAISGGSSTQGINWGSDGITNTGADDSRSVDGGLHWTDADISTLDPVRSFTVTIAFDVAVDLTWGQASDDGGGENNAYGSVYGVSGYSGTATVNNPTNQLVSVANTPGSVSFEYRDDVAGGGNDGIAHSAADWSIDTPLSTTYTVTYNGGNGSTTSIDHEWFAITDGTVVPEPSSMSLLTLGIIAFSFVTWNKCFMCFDFDLSV